MALRAFPRELAVRVLGRVLGERQALDEVLASVTGEIAPESRGWLQDVTSGTLRWKGRLDLAIDSVALKKKPTGWLRRVLLVSAYQLVVQESHEGHRAQVVSETVDVVKRKEGVAPAKFCNALLRKVAEHSEAWRKMRFPSSGTPAEQASWASLPEWMWRRLVEQRGLDWAQAYALASLERPALWVRGKTESWSRGLSGATIENGPFDGAWKICGARGAARGAVNEWAGFQEGEFFVQDISSQTLVHELTTHVGAAKRALDLCAAPGGKSAGMAWSGWSVVSSDIDVKRVPLLNQTAERVGQGRMAVMDYSAAQALRDLDVVWVDAPCSGSGILRRHPDVRWLRRESDLEGLNQTQLELVRRAWDQVRPGGYLMYSVCSVLHEEGPETIEKAVLSGAREREWLLTPHEAPYGDGFWAVLLKKQ